MVGAQHKIMLAEDDCVMLVYLLLVLQYIIVRACFFFWILLHIYLQIFVCFGGFCIYYKNSIVSFLVVILINSFHRFASDLNVLKC